MDEITTAPAPITLKVWETVRNSIKNIFHNFTPKVLAIAAFGIFYIIGLLLTIIINILLAGAHLSDLYYVYTLGIINTIGSAGSSTFITFFASMVVFGVIMLTLLSFLLTSLIKLSLAEEKMSLIDSLRGGFKQKFKFLGLLISAYFISTFSTIVFLIPGIYYFVALSLAGFLFIDQGTTVKQSILKSIYYVKGVWFRVFAVLVFSMILIMIFSVASTFILAIIGKILSSIPLLQRAVLWVSGILSFLISAASTLAMFSVLTTIYKTLKTKPEGDIGNNLKKPILIACIGVGLWIGLMYFMTVTAQNSLNTMKERAVRAAAIDAQSQDNQDIALYNLQHRTATGYEGQTTKIVVNGKSVNQFKGYNISFNYDKDWKSYEISSIPDIDALFADATNPDKKNYITLFVSSETVDSYTLAEKYSQPNLEQSKQSGTIEDYSISKWSQNPDVTITKVRFKGVLQNAQGNTEIESVSRLYSVTIGDVYIAFTGISPIEKEADLDQKLEQMIGTLKLDK